MDNFKIKSIEEFDLDFVAKYNEQKNNEISSVSSDGPIPEITKDEAEFENAENVNVSFFNNAETDEEPVQNFNSVVQDQDSSAFSPAPIDTYPQAYSPVGAPDANTPAYENEPAKTKQSGAAIAGKVISIILLAATIIVFVLGCFVTIFLDNNGSDLFGICFNTVSTDTYDSSGNLIVSKGDMIISQKAETGEFVSGKMIAVKSAMAGEENLSDIHVINSVMSVSGTNAQLTTTNLASPAAGLSTVMSEESYGIVTSYIPALGTVLHFAMDNAILICILFVLLAALWCLILVLIENQRNKKVKS